MGKYIETGDVLKDKAEWLKQNLSAIELTGMPTHVGPEFVPVCVVDNGPFEAAAIAYDRREAASFNSKSDKRTRKWVLIRREDAVRCCPSVDGMIDW